MREVNKISDKASVAAHWEQMDLSKC